MLSSPALDLIAGGSSFGLSGGLSLIGNAIQTNFKKTEQDKERSHEVTMAAIAKEKQQEDNVHHDVQRARALISKLDRTTTTGSFIGWTRRIIAMTVPFLVIALVVIAIISLSKGGINAISIPTESPHSVLFGLVKWTSHSVTQLSGLVWMPWFQLWFFMIGGFYFGRQIVK